MKSKLLRASPAGGYSVALEYEDGLEACLDFTTTLWGEMCEPLKDEAYFGKLVLEGNTVVWPNGFDICPDVLRFWAEVGRVTTQDEVNAHFQARGRKPLSVA